MNMENTRIPQLYAGKHVFITGGTGFMGKVLIERLLATCPDIGRIYILIRKKKNDSPSERLEQLKQSQVFSVIRQNCPWQMEKLVFVPGDITHNNLGLSLASIDSLKQIAAVRLICAVEMYVHPACTALSHLRNIFILRGQVSIVFHSAASVNLDASLPIAVTHNLLPVMEIMTICDNLPCLEVFIYVSTAYSNAEIDIIEEKVYPAPVTLEKLLNFTKNVPESQQLRETKKFIHPKPNAYIFTKAVAESVVAEHAKTARYSVAIFRPTIVFASVVSSVKNPFPGWIEKLYGPSGLIFGVGKGLLHVLHASDVVRTDQLPVDIAVDTLIAVGWKTALDRSKEVRVYNCSTIENPTTNGEFKKTILKSLQVYPLGKCLWHPFLIHTQNRYLHKILELSFQTLPLYAAGYLLSFFSIKISKYLITSSRKMASMSQVFSFFITREFNFEINNIQQLRARLSEADADIFNLDPRIINWDKYYRNFVYGVRQHLAKRADQEIENDRKFSQMLKFLHYSTITIIVMFPILLILLPTQKGKVWLGTKRLK